MGLVLDTTLLVAGDRQSGSAVDLVQGLLQSHELRDEVPVVSVISLAELARGRTRGETPANHERRQRLIRHIRGSFEIIELTADMAILAGLLSAELSAKGIAIGLADTLIAATAMERRFGVLTHNVRHFSYVPGLRVVSAAP